jgi:hypothetical protein
MIARMRPPVLRAWWAARQGLLALDAEASPAAKHVPGTQAPGACHGNAMRSLVWTTLLALPPGCTMNNPVFQLATETSATSGETGETTSSGATETGEATSSGALVSSSEASTQPVDTTGEPVMCDDPPVNTELVVEVTRNGEPYVDCVAKDEEYRGLLIVTGTSMSLKPTPDCMLGDLKDEMVLASGFAIPPALNPVCAKVMIRWDEAGQGCKLGLLEVHHAETDKMLYVGAFRLDPDPEFPLHTEGVNVTSCGCPADMPECCKPEPGVIDLIPSDGEPIAQGEHGHAKLHGVTYDFHNLQSWIDPTCVLGGDHGRHIDWLAVVVDGG